MSNGKKFVGRCKAVQTKYGEMLKIGITKEEFMEHQVDGWLNVIFKRAANGTPYLEVDDWKPDPSKRRPDARKKDDDDVPF